MPLKNYEHSWSTIQALASLGKIEGVIPLLHGPQPCLYQNQVGSMYCRPAQLLTAGTLINKSDVIFGGEESLKQQVKNIHKKYNPKMIVIINSCVPQLIGEDIDGVILELKDEIPELHVTYLNSGFNHPRSPGDWRRSIAHLTKTSSMRLSATRWPQATRWIEPCCWPPPS